MTAPSSILAPSRLRVIKPRLIQTPFAEALKWGPDSIWRDEEKLDGEFTLRTWGECVIAGEKMRNGDFYAFDLAFYHGDDIRKDILGHRLELLDELCQYRKDIVAGKFERPPEVNPNDMIQVWFRPRVGDGGDFLRRIVESGGEGIVRKCLNGRWGEGQVKAKRSEVFYCRVTAIHSQSVTVEETEISFAARQSAGLQPSTRTLQRAATRCPLRYPKIERIRRGSILKIVGYGQTAAGAIREPRIDTDTPASWIVKY